MRFAKSTVLFLICSVAVSHVVLAQEVGQDVVAKIVEALPNEPFAEPQKPRNILIYSKTLGFRHGSIPTGVKAFQMLGQRTRAFNAIHSENPAMFDAANLKQFDAVVMLNVTGSCLAPKNGELSNEEKEQLEQRKANLENFVKNGRGILGTHSATDAFYDWRTYGDMMGGWFTGHPWHENVPLKVDSPAHPLTQMFDAENGFQIKDEIYQFAPRGNDRKGYQPYDRDKLRVLLSLNSEKFDVSRGARNDTDYAISWIREYGKGRVFYSVLGHNDFIFYDSTVLKHYLAGLQYVLGDLAADASPSGSPITEKTKLIEPFNGVDLDGWRLKHARGSHWLVGKATVDADDAKKLSVEDVDGELINAEGKGVDIFTSAQFGDCRLEIELMVPKGSNSGIYFQGNYEVQVFDSFGKENPTAADIGGIYGAADPLFNAAKPPGEWQKFVIEFQAPRFIDEKKVKNAYFRRVELNGQVIHQNVEVTGATGGNLGQGEAAIGPLMFQGDHGPVAYRNIKVFVAED